MLIIAGHLVVDPADRSSFVAACRAAVEQARGAPGCLDFALSADTVDAARVNVFERWESQSDLLAFRGSGPDDDTGARILGAEVHRYLISRVEPP
jgi:quinol monooxygenase YgiN